MANSNGIHHIVKDNFKPGDKSICGRVMWSYDSPITLEHAKRCIELGTYWSPCKKCMKKSKVNNESSDSV